MALKRTSFRGCLLGMAVGDAMGYAVDSKTWAQIQEDYGPGGLMGYDTVNGYAEITSNTQLAAFTCNGLLIALTRGQMTGEMSAPVRYAALGGREWAASQRGWGRPDRTFCWLLHHPELCRRHCVDTRLLDTLNRQSPGHYGTMAVPVNHFNNGSSLTTAIAAGLFMGPAKMPQAEIDLLGAETVALTHGSPTAFFSGAALAHIISRSLYHPEVSLRMLVNEACQMLKETYGAKYSQCFEVSSYLQMAMNLAADPRRDNVEAMEKLQCKNAGQILAGAIYACLTRGDNFDSAMITAVNHSGESAAVGAVAGAILGLRQGEEALPEFYLDGLEPEDLLRELADDLYSGCPMELGSRLFDLDWDRKYVHGGNE